MVEWYEFTFGILKRKIYLFVNDDRELGVYHNKKNLRCVIEKVDKEVIKSIYREDKGNLNLELFCRGLVNTF